MASRYHIDLASDYHTLRISDAEAIIAAADEWKYRKPRNANGSRSRYFFAYLQRLVNREPE